MSINHHKEVGDVMYLLRDGLREPIIAEFERFYKAKHVFEIASIVETPSYSLPDVARTNRQELIESLDTYRVLKLVRSRWRNFRPLFKNRDDVDLLYEDRNNWAHQVPFTNQRAQSTAKACVRVLAAVGASGLINQVNAIVKSLEQKLEEQHKPTFSKEIQRVHDTIEQLTHDQLQVIHDLTGMRRVAISGCAGSGKTLIAAEKAIRLAEAGVRTLILCHNPNLAAYIEQLTKGSNVHVQDFSSWIYQLLSYDESEANTWTHFSEPTDEQLNIAFDNMMASSERYEAIIVDEGQDFREEWWLLIEAAFCEPQAAGILYIFYDNNQALLPHRSKYPIETSSFPLQKNCRNALEIVQIIDRLHTQRVGTDLQHRGGIVRVSRLTLTKELADVQQALSYGENLGIQRQNMVILTTDYLDNTLTTLAPLTNYKKIDQFENVDKPLTFKNNLVEQKYYLSWRGVVSNYLRLMLNEVNTSTRKHWPNYQWKYGAPPVLSQSVYPSPSDIGAVLQFARFLKLELFRGGYVEDNNAVKINWHSNKEKIFIASEDGYEITKKLGDKNAAIPLIHFFSSHTWNTDLQKNIDSATQYGKSDNALITDRLPKKRSPVNKSNNNKFVEIGIPPLAIYSVDTIKGLESEGVIMLIPYPKPNLETELYVGISRAKFLIYIITVDEVMKVLPHLELRFSDENKV